MIIKTKTYELEFSPEELRTIQLAITFAYNTIYNREHPKTKGDDFYIDAAEDCAKIIIDGKRMEELRSINRMLQTEVRGGCQSW